MKQGPLAILGGFAPLKPANMGMEEAAPVAKVFESELLKLDATPPALTPRGSVDPVAELPSPRETTRGGPEDPSDAMLAVANAPVAPAPMGLPVEMLVANRLADGPARPALPLPEDRPIEVAPRPEMSSEDQAPDTEVPQTEELAAPAAEEIDAPRTTSHSEQGQLAEVETAKPKRTSPTGVVSRPVVTEMAERTPLDRVQDATARLDASVEIAEDRMVRLTVDADLALEVRVRDRQVQVQLETPSNQADQFADLDQDLREHLARDDYELERLETKVRDTEPTPDDSPVGQGSLINTVA